MAKIETEWFEKVDDVLYNDTSTAQLDELVGKRVFEIYRTVDSFVARDNMFQMTLAEFTSGPQDEAISRYVEHAAMIGYLARRGLLSQYYERKETAFTNATLNEQVNWYVQVVDSGWGKRIGYKILSQVGDDGESWSYKMKVQKG